MQESILFFEYLIHTGIEIFQNSNLHFQMPIQVRKKNSNTYIFHVNISSDCVDPIAKPDAFVNPFLSIVKH